jgi:hypothetical protein
MKHRKPHVFFYFTLAFACALFLSCIVPAMPADKGTAAGTGTLVVNVSDADATTAIVKTARTVVPGIAGISGQAVSYTISCTNTITSATVSPPMTSFGPQTISNLSPGEYTITVNAYKMKNETNVLIATGSATVTVGEGALVPAYIKLKPAQTGGGTPGKGSFALTIKWPTASADQIWWYLDGSGETRLTNISTPPITSDGTTSTVIIKADNLDSGIHTVRINFNMNGATGTGTQLEIVNVYDNMESNMFVGADGSLSDSRTYTAAEVMNMADSVNTGVTMRVIEGDTMSTPPLIASGSVTLPVRVNAVTVIPTVAVPGQRIEISQNGGTYTQIASDMPITEIVNEQPIRNTTLLLKVTPPNNAPPTTYTLVLRSPVHVTDYNILGAALAYLDNNVILDNDITVPDSVTWPPIGNETSKFTGTLNGNGHTITFMTTISTSTGDAGMFGVIASPAVITDVHLKNVSVSGGTSDDGVGGLVGENYGGTITRCSVTGYVEGLQGVGGLVGNNRIDDATPPTWRSVISECYSTATVKGTAQYPGGLVGQNWGTISNSYARSNILNGGGGGLVDYNFATGIIENCYAAGSGSLLGGLARGNAGTCTENYYDSTFSGMTDSIGATGITTANAKTQGSYSGWNFSSVWAIDAARNSGYPYLKNNAQPVVSLPSNMTATDFAAMINADLTGDFIIDPGVSTVTLTGTLTPIGTTDTPFRGTFDGNGKTITGLTVADNSYAGMFGTVDPGAIIKNLQLTGVSVTGAANAHKGGLVSYNRGTIWRCSTSGIVTGDVRVGGLVGRNDGTVSECWSNASVTGSYAGGLVGENYGTIENSYARGRLSTNDGGGLLGWNRGSGIVRKCYAASPITPPGTPAYIQGLVGRNDGGTVEASFFDASKIVTSYSGGTTPAPSIFGSPRTPESIRMQSSFNWDFTSVWNTSTGKNGGYHYLRNVTPTTDIGISTQAQLESISDLNGDYYLTGNIDLSSNSDWTPIGNATTPFTGAFNGNGRSIANLTKNSATPTNEGLFGVIGSGGYICKVTLTNVTVANTSTDIYYASGMLAGVNYGLIVQCSALGSVSGYNYVGGLIGTNAGTIRLSYARGMVRGSNSQAGGLVGGNGGTIQLAYAFTAVSGRDNVGGLIGNMSGGSVLDCYARGLVTSRTMTYDPGRTGGFVGGFDGGSIQSAYASCDLSVTPSTITTKGGFAGNKTGGTFTSCYYDSSKGGATAIGEGSGTATGLNTASMKVLTNFTGFGGSWACIANKNAGFPHLTGAGLVPADDISLSSSMNKTAIYNALNDNKNGNFVLTDSITLAGSWTSVGTKTSPFTGTFDGNGKTIINSTTVNSGMFGYLGASGSIQNLTIGCPSGYTPQAFDTGNYWAGGLVAINNGTISRCAVYGLITSTAKGVGGIAGVNRGIITQCYSSAAVTGSDWEVGGLVGNLQGQGCIIDSFASGRVSGSMNRDGGLIGSSEQNGTVLKCYSTGTVTGTTDVSGLVGFNDPPASIVGSFYDKDTSGWNNGNGTANSTTAMKMLATFQNAGWSITNIADPSAVWGIDITGAINNGYPYLQYFGSATVLPPLQLASIYNNTTAKIFSNTGVRLSEPNRNSIANSAYKMTMESSLTTSDPDLIFGSTNNFTICGWFRIDNYTSGGTLFYRGGNSNSLNYGVFVKSGGTIDAQLSTSGNGSSITSVNPLATPTATWFHVALTYSGATSKEITLYVNGTNKSSTTFTYSGFEAGSFWFGNFNGAMSDLKIYDSALTASEIATVLASP